MVNLIIEALCHGSTLLEEKVSIPVAALLEKLYVLLCACGQYLSM